MTWHQLGERSPTGAASPLTIRIQASRNWSIQPAALRRGCGRARSTGGRGASNHLTMVSALASSEHELTVHVETTLNTAVHMSHVPCGVHSCIAHRAPAVELFSVLLFTCVALYGFKNLRPALSLWLYSAVYTFFYGCGVVCRHVGLSVPREGRYSKCRFCFKKEHLFLQGVSRRSTARHCSQLCSVAMSVAFHRSASKQPSTKPWV